LARELIRFIDVRGLPTIMCWHNRLTSLRNTKENTKVPKGLVVQDIFSAGDLELETAR
jgi:hypothetical protein